MGGELRRIGTFSLGWGESTIWDEARQRLYVVDCAASTVHWLDDEGGALGTFRPPSMATGLVPTDDGRLVAVLEDGLHVVDVDAGTSELLAPYPDALGGRANDACADLDGNLITGRLNVGPAEGSAWWFSLREGWRLVDPDISNTNGPAVGVVEGTMTLIIGDTSAHYFAYDYDPATGGVGPRRVFGDTSGLGGRPDGSTLDADGGLWCALVGGSRLARFTVDGVERTMHLPVPNPTDVTFGGADLDRLYVVSIGPSLGESGQGLEGALLAIDGLGVVGRPEPRFALSSG